MLEAIETQDPFEWFANLKVQTYVGKPDKVKKLEAHYYISGHIKPGQDGLKRNNDSLMYRDLIFIDLDDVQQGENELLTLVAEKLHDVNYIMYPSISHGTKGVRYRLIVEPARVLDSQEYKHMVGVISANLGVEIDETSKTWSQLEGGPIATKEQLSSYKIIVNRSKKLDIPDEIASVVEEEDLTIFDEFEKTELLPMIPHAEAIQMIKNYVETDADNLTNYTNAVHAILVLAQAVRNEEIEQETALECSNLLAMGNGDWETGNRIKLKKEMQNPHIKSDYSFREKFVDSVKYISTTMEEIYSKLKDAGEDWRRKNTANNGKPLRMNENIAARILGKYCEFRLIGPNPDKSPLYIYNLQTGIYESNEKQLNKFIKAVVPFYNPPQWKNVIGHLKTDARWVRPLADRYLIPVNNGVYNLKTKRLLDFSPDYPITSKIATPYVRDAKSPYIKGFDIDEWFNSIACGDNEIVMLLWQIINEAINPNYTRGKLGFMIGGGNNGKGTYQMLLVNLIGLENISSLKPDQFGQRFQTSSLLGKVANIGDDISNAYIDEISDLMSIATGDIIAIEEKHKPSIEASLKTFCLFSGNNMPRNRNRSKGWYRRALIIPFNADFNGEKEDKDIKDIHLENKKVLEYVLYKAINLEFSKFIEPKALQAALTEHQKENDYVAAYIYDHYIENGYHKLGKMPVKAIKEDMNEFFDTNQLKQTLPYHWTKNFVEMLAAATGLEYKIGPARYANEEVQLLPIDILHDIKTSKNERSVILSA